MNLIRRMAFPMARRLTPRFVVRATGPHLGRARPVRRAASSNTVEEATAGLSLSACLFFLGAHGVLGIVVQRFPFLATAHAAISLVTGLYIAWMDRSTWKVPLVVGYIAASEVVWRMAGAGVFWEFGKYAVSLILVLWTLRNPPSRYSWCPVIYFVLLVPSVMITMTSAADISSLRNFLSFNLSGPLSMAICAFCLFGRRVDVNGRMRILVAVLGPLVSIAAACSLGTFKLGDDYEFGSESNFDTSGGYGPNQVSSVLGWGCLLAFLWAQTVGNKSHIRWFAYGLVLYFFAQAALTFSRSGVWIATVTVMVAIAFMVRRSSGFYAILFAFWLLFGLGYWILFPALDQFTSGMLSERFAEKGFTHREDIARGDLLLALNNPALGVGPGMARSERTKQLGIGGAPHTEFTRVLAEHGSAGLLALVSLSAFGVMAFRLGRSPIEKAWSASLLVYGALFMLVSGMRLVAPSMAVGLAALGCYHRVKHQVTGDEMDTEVRRLVRVGAKRTAR